MQAIQALQDGELRADRYRRSCPTREGGGQKEGKVPYQLVSFFAFVSCQVLSYLSLNSVLLPVRVACSKVARW